MGLGYTCIKKVRRTACIMFQEKAYKMCTILDLEVGKKGSAVAVFLHNGRGLGWVGIARPRARGMINTSIGFCTSVTRTRLPREYNEHTGDSGHEQPAFLPGLSQRPPSKPLPRYAL